MSGRLDTNKLDINKLFEQAVELGRAEEHADERAVRLRSAARRDLIEDCKDTALFVIVLGVVLALGGACAWLALFASGVSDGTARWAQSILTGIVTGGLSFLIGRALPKK